jgi:hypothetical protein
MKSLQIAFLMLICIASVASEVMYSNEDAGLTISKTDEISDISVDGNYLSFDLNSERFFTLTAFALKSSAEQYPIASELNEAFYQSQMDKKQNFKLIDKGKINILFNEKNIEGSMYTTHYLGSSRMLCDMNFIHPVGSQYYWVMTLTTSTEECEGQKESLMKSLGNVYKGISVEDD